MKKIIFIIIIVLILVAGFFLFYKNQTIEKSSENNFDNNLDVVIRDMTNVPAEFFSGDSRYSYGECQQDAECHAMGCNLEMCSSDENIMTTCEIDGNAPDKIQYACGCIKERCGWYEK